MIAPEAGLSVSRQCALLGVARSSFYYRPRPKSAEELELLKRLDRIFTGNPVYGSRRLQVALWTVGCADPRLTAPARSPMDKPAKTRCVSPALPTGPRLPTSFTAPHNNTG